MDISTLATTVISVLSPYLAKGVETLAEGIGKDLWNLIKKPFTSEREKKMLDELQQNPEDKILQGKIAGKLEEHLEANPELAKQLDVLVAKAGEQKINTQTQTGNDNVGFQDVKIGGNLNLNKGKNTAND